MALQFYTISEITSKSMQWNLKVRGDRIHASLRKFIIKHFRESLYELGVYQMNYFTTTHKHKLTFTLNTKVTKIQDPSSLKDIFNIRTFEQLTIHHNVDKTELLRLSLTSSQKHHSIFDESSKEFVSFTYLHDLIQCSEESSFWIAAKIAFLELDHKWSYLSCNNCITKVDTEGTKYYCTTCNSEVKYVIHRFV
ncbi:hypothetical protein R3W88_033024 [Solanum pinnatisectum]|uniref:Replication factor A C-terminal domain-containing protein n=1 Tax=Solanum pinnatisectum TaxID=50273 RepID=A0AAV9K2A2_9SOLN|nr:hypothetical protein R3W88_033024 [Solanum pinnatisectum]